MSVNVEGTAAAGENDVDEGSDFYKWMISQKASPVLIKKLLESGYDSKDMIASIDLNADFADVVQELDLKKTSDKIRLKTIIKSFGNKHTLIDKEETQAMIEMEKKLKDIKNAVKLVAETEKKIDTEVTKHTQSIKATFKEMHQSLNKREQYLIDELNKIAKTKKQTLKKASKLLNKQTIQSQQKINLCHQSLKKSIEITEIEQRKKGIIKIAKDIKNIDIISKDDPLINGNKINIKLDKVPINKMINQFGNVSTDGYVSLISLTDNKDCSISVKYKINDLSKNNNNNKLKIEWNEIKSNDNDNDMDQRSEFNKEININNNNKNIDKIININIDNKITNYLFRLKYFDGVKWSINSNTKTISIKEMFVDSWDPNCKGDGLTISGNSIINSNAKGSAYLKRIVSKGIHCWKFRIDNRGPNWQLIGVWKTKFTPIVDNYFATSGKKCYAFGFDGEVVDPNVNVKKLRDYGVKIKNGDTIEMILNLIDLTLSYKINGTDYGKAFDVEQTSYRVAVRPRKIGTRYTILSYQCKAMNQ